LETYTADTLFDPPLTVFQPRTGYRFSLDPLILAAHIHPNPNDSIIDMGCGCGIVSLILGARHKDVQITGVEIQKELAFLAKKNALQNGLNSRIHILHQDIRNLSRTDITQQADIIVSNPPYKKKASGRLNPDTGKALARHEITLDIATLVDRAGMFVKPGGQLCLIFPAPRMEELILCLRSAGFAPQWIRLVHFRPAAPAQRILVSAVKSKEISGIIRPPLHLYNPDRTPTEDHLRLLNW
jgi:tRNA1Val (adenine37-N6)-methyltransferase